MGVQCLIIHQKKTTPFRRYRSVPWGYLLDGDQGKPHIEILCKMGRILYTIYGGIEKIERT